MYLPPKMALKCLTLSFADSIMDAELQQWIMAYSSLCTSYVSTPSFPEYGTLVLLVNLSRQYLMVSWLMWIRVRISATESFSQYIRMYLLSRSAIISFFSLPMGNGCTCWQRRSLLPENCPWASR